MNKQTQKFVIGGVLILVIAVVVFVSISSDNMTYYQTPSEILASPEKFQTQKIRVMGRIQPGTVTWEPSATQLDFQITDDGNTFLKVSYVGSKPDMFKEGQGVVVEGKLLEEGRFQASKLLVKHSEEYKNVEHDKQKSDYYKSVAQ